MSCDQIAATLNECLVFVLMSKLLSTFTTMVDLKTFQASYEQRFGCCICLGPKLNMVSGQCQHRICDECLYENNSRRPCMKNCPICGFCDSFPMEKPIIPTQVLEVQKCLGVQQCMAGCSEQLWWWEMEEHASSCPKMKKEAVTHKVKIECRKRYCLRDRGVVSVTSRLTRQGPKTCRKLPSSSVYENI